MALAQNSKSDPDVHSPLNFDQSIMSKAMFKISCVLLYFCSLSFFACGVDEEKRADAGAVLQGDAATTDAAMTDATIPEPDAGPKACTQIEFPASTSAIWQTCSSDITSCYEAATSVADVDACFAEETAECEQCFMDEFLHCVEPVCIEVAVEFQCCLDEACPTGATECQDEVRNGICKSKWVAWLDCTGNQNSCLVVPPTCVEDCQPESCQSQGASCGPMGDGCGGTLNCGGCTGTDSCAGGGIENQCGCTPLACESSSCGLIPDGCGGTITCGGCLGDDSCGGGGVDNQCGCTPTTCQTEGLSCGTVANGCGGTLNCGVCPLLFDYEPTALTSFQTSVSYQQSVSFQATVRNNGIDPAPTTEIHFLYSANTSITSFDTEICSRFVPALAPGASTDLNATCMVPALLTGTYYLGVLVDPLNTRLETSESNNSRLGIAVAVTAPSIDLEYRQISDASNFIKMPGDIVTYILSIANLGSDSVGDFDVSLHYSSDMSINSFDPLICTRTMPGMLAQTITEYTFECVVPPLSTGNYYVGVRIDPTNEVLETNEANNISDIPFAEWITN